MIIKDALRNKEIKLVVSSDEHKHFIISQPATHIDKTVILDREECVRLRDYLDSYLAWKY